MKGLRTLFLLLTTCLASRADDAATLPDIQVQENFIESLIYGKWFNLAVGSTCPWLRRIKDKLSMSTLVLQEGATEAEISMTSTRWRTMSPTLGFLFNWPLLGYPIQAEEGNSYPKGLSKKSEASMSRERCLQEISGAYEKTDIDGKFLYHKSKWNITLETYVVHTNYDEYAIFLTKKFSHYHGPTITLKLYGREPKLRDSLLLEFREVALSMGIPENSIVFMADKGECVPGDQEVKPSPHLRARRAVLPQENEGSGSEPLVTGILKKEDSCQLTYSEGPCLGMMERYHYNGTSMACETFQYGGCLGNGNNFISEKECLQTCRTVAACNLPIVQGPCRAYIKLWAFDAAQGKCIQFTYGGCKGNGNKFYSEKECKEYCGVPGDGDKTN